MRNQYLIVFLFLCIVTGLEAQESRKPISLQGIIKQGDELLINQVVHFKLGLYSDTTLQSLWEEKQDTLTNDFALFNLYLGVGNPTGNAQFNNFNLLPWSDPVWMKIAYRLNEANDYIEFSIRKFQAMPFAMYADSASGEGVGVMDLFDVENNDQIEFILKWDGEKWISSPDAIYAWNTFSADSSIYSDTALYAWSMLDPTPTDSVNFSFYSDSVSYVVIADTSQYSENSFFADTATFANDVLNAWKLSGNIGSNKLGISDSTDLVIKSNNSEAIRITEAGEVLINIPINSHADFQTKGSVAFQGGHEPYSIDTTLENTFYWDPKKSSIVVGNDMTYDFADSSGQYSFAGGQRSLANSFSFAWGDSCIASGNNVVAIGKNNKATIVAFNKKGSSVVLGTNNESTIERAVAIGTNIKIGDLGGTNSAIGSYIEILDGGGITALGNNLINNGRSFIMIGNYLRSNSGSWTNWYSLMIGDHSTDTYMENSASIMYRFYIRADGGTFLYSDSLLSTGVILYPGSGSWAMLSDRTQKENILPIYWAGQQTNSLSQIEIYKWQYRPQKNKVYHLGPMAQELNNRFGFKENRQRLSMIDMDGLTFMGIGSLIEKFERDENLINKVENGVIEIKDKQKQVAEMLKIYESMQKGGVP